MASMTRVWSPTVRLPWVAWWVWALAVWLPAPLVAAEPAYVETYAKLLTTHSEAVDAKVGTRVDYAGLASDPAWSRLVAELGAVAPAELKTRDERVAFWINAYNILAMDLVRRSYPVESIRDIGSFFRPVWKVEAGQIAGRAYSLGEIEHEILRPLGEPRIHAAIVCASISCPNLLREPYRAALLDRQLDASSRAWLARPEKGLQADRERSILWLSPILDWFEEDFGGRAGVLDYVAAHVAEADAAWIRQQGTSVRLEYFDYDWRLND